MSNFPQITVQYAESNNRKFLYWVQGDSKKPTLLFLYGFTGTAKDFFDLAELLKDKFFIIIPEYPGWNRAPRLKEKPTIHSYAKHIKALLDYMEIKETYLVGHCFGGVVAIELAYLYPEMVKKMILVSPPYLGGSKSEKFHKFLVGWLEHSPDFLKPIFFFWRSRILSVPFDFFAIKLKDMDKKLDRIKEHIVKQPTEPEDIMEENWISYIEYNFDKVKKIKIPTYMIHGGKDIIVSSHQAEKFKKIFSNAHLEIIPNAGHVPTVETTRELASLIKIHLS